MAAKKVDLQGLRALAQTVAEEHEEHQRAIRDLREAEAATLQAAIVACSAALPAIVNRVVKSGGRGDDEDVYFDERCALLAADGVDGLYLLRDGRLALIEDSAGPEVPWIDRTLRVLDAGEAMARFRLPECLESLEKHLTEQRGKRKQRADEAVRRAEALRKTLAESGFAVKGGDDELPF